MEDILPSLVLEKSKDFDSTLDREIPHKIVSNKEIKKVFKQQFGTLRALEDALLSIGLYLSPNQQIKKPENIPHIISNWPIMYNASSKSPPEKYLVGYVKMDLKNS